MDGEVTVKKIIGILGGISAVSTAAYYQRLIKAYDEQCGDSYYPEIVIYSLDFQKFTDFENSGDRAGYIQEIMHGIERLQNAGADFVIMAANSPHAVYDQVEALAKVPMLSIVEVTADYAAKRGFKTLLLMGIRFTMQSSFYQAACEQRHITVVVPSLDEQQEIDRLIFEELAIGVFTKESKQKLLTIGTGYDVDGIILGCTELPLILKPSDSPIPLLDTLDLHVRASLAYALT
jgi:aspartate racemase